MSKYALSGLTLGVVIAVGGIAFVGCASDRPRRSEEFAAPLEEKTPEMEGQAEFHDGQLVVAVLLNRAGFGARPDNATEGRSRGESGGRGGGRMGFGGGRGRRASGRNGGDGAESASATSTASIRPSNLPPVRLHLRFTNRTTTAIEVEVPQFDSDLGNFVVQPSRIIVPPNGAAEAEPMTSRLGVPADQVPITMSVRAKGATEHQVILLKMSERPSPTPES